MSSDIKLVVRSGANFSKIDPRNMSKLEKHTLKNNNVLYTCRLAIEWLNKEPMESDDSIFSIGGDDLWELFYLSLSFRVLNGQTRGSGSAYDAAIASKFRSEVAINSSGGVLVSSIPLRVNLFGFSGSV